MAAPLLGAPDRSITRPRIVPRWGSAPRLTADAAARMATADNQRRLTMVPTAPGSPAPHVVGVEGVLVAEKEHAVRHDWMRPRWKCAYVEREAAMLAVRVGRRFRQSDVAAFAEQVEPPVGV